MWCDTESVTCLVSVLRMLQAKERKRAENRRYYEKLQREPHRLQRLKRQQKAYRDARYRKASNSDREHMTQGASND